MRPESEGKLKWLLDMMRGLAPDGHVPTDDHAMVHVYQNRYMAQIMALVAEEQSLSADKVETQTKQLISLTRILVWLTAGLLVLTLLLAFLTFVLYQDSHAMIERDRKAEHRQNEQRE